MPARRSDKSRFESRHGGGFVSAAQYLAEVACERIAIQKRKELPVRFWQKPEWLKDFKAQLHHANLLLKKHPAGVVLSALRCKKGEACYSLGAPWLKPLLKSEQEKADRAALQLLEAVGDIKEGGDCKEPLSYQPPAPFVPAKNPLDKLRDLE